MAGNSYSGTTPIAGVYALDNGGDIRFFFSEKSLAAAIVNGYARDSSNIYKKRPASLQWFGADGHADISHWIDKPIPAGLNNARGRRGIAEEVFQDKQAALRPIPKASTSKKRKGQ